MPGCLSWAALRASRRKRSMSSGLASRPARRILMATVRSSSCRGRGTPGRRSRRRAPRAARTCPVAGARRVCVRGAVAGRPGDGEQRGRNEVLAFPAGLQAVATGSQGIGRRRGPRGPPSQSAQEATCCATRARPGASKVPRANSASSGSLGAVFAVHGSATPRRSAPFCGRSGRPTRERGGVTGRSRSFLRENQLLG